MWPRIHQYIRSALPNSHNILPSTTLKPASIPCPFPSIHPNHTPIRTAVSTLRPRKSKFRKAQKGYFPVHTGGSLRGTGLYYGDYGLRALEPGRLSDTQLDAARAAIRKVLKAEKDFKIFLTVFPSRPVTAKGAETRMGKGKGMVDYYAVWVAQRKMLFEVKGVTEDVAKEAFRVASTGLPILTEFVSRKDTNEVPPRVLPHFIKERIKRHEALNNQSGNRSSVLEALGISADGKQLKPVSQ
ncbi:hypothetical protein SeMB42_g00797 [Synchytrium endobioticum]|uniref:Uncharacterized protein n=1 Tax=Synchytrium endobioticum TaxID=286115 RepID=A0A507DJR7_9FUNG|nr:hypothetical protein SeLEV6574_g00282 [Synchytrium endobioticum]TPX53410.1 hypothetical protein SeMB42_g00797 [Synchytrium endobioticum]